MESYEYGSEFTQTFSRSRAQQLISNLAPPSKCWPNSPQRAAPDNSQMVLGSDIPE